MGPWGRAFHGLFGVMMVCAAIFAARPWDESLPFDSTEDLVHSVAAFVMGVAFALGVLAVMLRRPVELIGRCLFDWVAIAFIWYGVQVMTSDRDATAREQEPAQVTA